MSCCYCWLCVLLLVGCCFGTGSDFFACSRIHPSGEWMLVANEASGNVVVLAIDKETGLLEPTGAEEGGMPTAMCVVFVPSTAAAL